MKPDVGWIHPLDVVLIVLAGDFDHVGAKWHVHAQAMSFNLFPCVLFFLDINCMCLMRFAHFVTIFTCDDGLPIWAPLQVFEPTLSGPVPRSSTHVALISCALSFTFFFAFAFSFGPSFPFALAAFPFALCAFSRWRFPERIDFCVLSRLVLGPGVAVDVVVLGVEVGCRRRLVLRMDWVRLVAFGRERVDLHRRLERGDLLLDAVVDQLLDDSICCILIGKEP